MLSPSAVDELTWFNSEILLTLRACPASSQAQNSPRHRQQMVNWDPHNQSVVTLPPAQLVEVVQPCGQASLTLSLGKCDGYVYKFTQRAEVEIVTSDIVCFDKGRLDSD